MTIIIVIIKPRQEVRLECGWRHARNRWSWEFEDFEKESVKKLRLDDGSRELSSCCWDIYLDLGHWRCSWVFFIFTDRDLKHRKMCCVFGMISIVRIVSFLVLKNWSQELINRSYLKQHSPSVFAFAFVYVLYYCWIDIITAIQH